MKSPAGLAPMFGTLAENVRKTVKASLTRLGRASRRSPAPQSELATNWVICLGLKSHTGLPNGDFPQREAARIRQHSAALRAASLPARRSGRPLTRRARFPILRRHERP